MVVRVGELQQRVTTLRRSLLPAFAVLEKTKRDTAVAKAAAVEAAVEAAAAAAASASVENAPPSDAAQVSGAGVNSVDEATEPPVKKAKTATSDSISAMAATEEAAAAAASTTATRTDATALDTFPKLMRRMSPHAWAVSQDALRRVVGLLYDVETAGEAGSDENNNAATAPPVDTLNRQQAEQVLLGLTAARLGPLSHHKGWKSWSRVEALAAFELMDQNKVGESRVDGFICLRLEIK